jgi:hypothetical protein
MYSKEGKSFRDVDLPFYGGDGIYVVTFTTNRRNLSLNVFAEDCIDKLFLNEERVDGGKCFSCKHCGGVRINAYFNSTNDKLNNLGVKTTSLGESPFFYVENSKNDFIWRILAISSIMALSVLIFLGLAGKDTWQQVKYLHRRVLRNRNITVLLLVSAIIQIMVASVGVESQDIHDGVLWAESILHKHDLNLLRHEQDYWQADQLDLNKPPLAYPYPFVVLRLLFGFSALYMTQIVKLPAIAGCLLVGYLIWRTLRERMTDRRIPLIAAGLFVLNPGVLIQSAALGKHDSLAIGIILLALINIDGKRFSAYYGLSHLSKQMSLFVLPWMIIQRRMFGKTAVAGLIFILLMLPFMIDPLLAMRQLLGTHTEKAPTLFSWMTILNALGVGDVVLVSNIFMAAYVLILTALAFTVVTDSITTGALAFSLFILFSKVVYEQYILWSLPFLIIVYFLRRQKTVLAAFVIGSISCAISYREYYKAVFRPDILDIWNILMGLTFLCASVSMIRSSLKQQKL